jgi:hypothetical protein
MGEVQKHGLTWELNILQNVYGCLEEEWKTIPRNAKMDLPGTWNRLDPGVNLSIKTTGKQNAVCMGDCLRVYDAVNSGEPLHMVVLIYEQNDATKTKKMKQVLEIDLTGAREQLFGSITRAQIEHLDQAVKTIPQKRKPTTKEHEHMYAIRDELQPDSVAIHFDIKCNSTQSRLQCSFHRFQQFLETNKERIVAELDTSARIFRGKKITEEISSSRRVFKKNKKPTESDASE